MTRILAGNCFFVKGYKMNLIFDLQNASWYHIKETQEEILSLDLEYSVKKYLEAHGIILDVPNFLVDSLPKINTHYCSPQRYEGLIIDIDAFSTFNISDVLKKLDYINFNSLQLRFFHIPDIHYLETIINNLDFYMIESTEIIIPYSTEIINMLEKNNFLLKASKVFRIVFHSVPQDIKLIKSKVKKIFYTSEIIENDTFCGQISAFNFSSNPKHFFKSLHFNSCLHKKIGIDTNGNVKNCPSLSYSIANIHNFDKTQIVEKAFQTANIIKDDIDVCKDCEFRYICTDCRAFTDSKSRPNARPSKCQYNPYISKWSHEEGYLTLEECGVISNEHGFSIDHEKIAEINKQLWGE